MFDPKTINTDDIKIPDELIELIDLLSENTHNHWAKLRIQDGWSWGAYRSDIYKTTPCLLPFELLKESDQAYDRRIAEETIKAIIAMGYQIIKIDQGDLV